MEEEKMIYLEILQEEIQQGVVTRIPKKDALFLNRNRCNYQERWQIKEDPRLSLSQQKSSRHIVQRRKLQKVAKLTLGGYWASVLDISDAYNHIKVSKELQKYFAFTFAKETYTYIDMPF
ncbi:MAG: hypothetical protein EZS28_039044, partial [Streblomastix strix]